jgi:hypothetical protein
VRGWGAAVGRRGAPGFVRVVPVLAHCVPPFLLGGGENRGGGEQGASEEGEGGAHFE